MEREKTKFTNTVNLIRIIYLLYLFFSLTSNNILFEVMFTTYQSAMNLLFFLKPSTYQELLSDWLIYLTELHLIGRSKVNEWLHRKTNYFL